MTTSIDDRSGWDRVYKASESQWSARTAFVRAGDTLSKDECMWVALRPHQRIAEEESYDRTSHWTQSVDNTILDRLREQKGMSFGKPTPELLSARRWLLKPLQRKFAEDAAKNKRLAPHPHIHASLGSLAVAWIYWHVLFHELGMPPDDTLTQCVGALERGRVVCWRSRSGALVVY